MSDLVCADCGKACTVRMVMKPGKDGQEWYICARCYNDGRNTRVHKPMKAEPVSQEFVDALVATGWTEKPDGQGNTIVSPPDRRR